MYSRFSPFPQSSAFAAISPVDLTPEIQLLRSYCQEILAASAEDKNLADSIQTARAVALLSSAINRLSRTQILLSRLLSAGSSVSRPEDAP